MKSLKLILVVLTLNCSLFTFLCEAQYPTRYFIQFTDKINNGYSLSNPSAFLSARAIARRTNQSIGYDSLDLPITQAYIDTIMAHGAIVLNHSKWLNGVCIATADTNILNDINALPFVAHSVWVGAKKKLGDNGGISLLSKETMMNDKTKSNHATKNTQSLNYGAATNQITMIHGDYLHDLGFMGEGMVIAVMDAGFLHVDTIAGFDSIRVNNQILGTKDFVVGDTSVYEDDGHGCMVLSCIAANLPGQMIGTGPHANFWLIRTEDAPTENIIEEYTWAMGAEFADSVGADIISSSLGYTRFDHTDQDHTYSDMTGRICPSTKAATVASERGILVIVAEMNEGDHFFHFVGAPADADSILAIGAVDYLGNYVSFSSKGPSYDGRVKPDVADQGLSSTVILPATGTVGTSSGTSFATPILAGAAACFWQAHPTMTNMQVRHAIIASATQYTNPDTLEGYGIPNFELANSITTGQSIVNAKETISVTVYPNPCVHHATFFINGSIDTKDATILIYDLLGQPLRTISLGNNRKISFDKGKLSSGMYFYELHTHQGQTAATGKLIIE